MTDPGTGAWWRALPPAEAEIPCGGGRHRVRWADGELILPAHPDPEAELILGALGGDPAACADLAENWAQHRDDLTVFTLGPRWAADEVIISPDQLDEPGPPAGSTMGGMLASGTNAPGVPWLGPSTQRQVVHGPPARPHLRHRLGQPAPELLSLLSVLALGPAFQRRLAGTVAAAWAGQDRAAGRAAHRPALAGALTGRLAPVAGLWAGIDPDLVRASLHEDDGWGSAEVTGPGGGITGPGGGRWLRVSLPLRWLAEVWAAGLAVVEGHLVVAVRSARWPRAEVLALPRPGAAPVTVRVRTQDPGDGAHWWVTGNG